MQLKDLYNSTIIFRNHLMSVFWLLSLLLREKELVVDTVCCYSNVRSITRIHSGRHSHSATVFQRHPHTSVRSLLVTYY